LDIQALNQNLDAEATQLLGHEIDLRATIVVVAEDGD
jgi:hypothetical protein